MNILCLHATIRCRYFQRQLEYFQAARGCRIAVASSLLDRHNYAGLLAAGASHLLLPDLDAPQPWEGDPARVAALLDLAGRCEQATGRSLNRMVLGAERTYGCALGWGAYHLPPWKIHAACRRDNSLPQRMALRVFAVAAQFLEEFPPDLILVQGFNDALNMSLWMLAQLRGIPILAVRYSKVVSQRIFFTPDFFMENVASKAAYLAKAEARAEPSAKAMEYLAAFRDAPRPVDYIRNNWLNVGGWWKSHRMFLGLCRTKLRYRLAGGEGRRPLDVWPKILEYYRIKCMEVAHRRYFGTFSEEQLQGMRYVYFPLHKEPELMLNFKAPLWHDSLHAVKYISSMLPVGYRLLVREHRFNWGRRYGRYLQDMRGLPGVSLVDPFDSQFKYIRNAAVVLTDNGSSGYEGIMFRRPVVLLEHAFYDVLPQARRVPDPTVLDRALLSALADPPRDEDPEYDRHLGRFIDAELEHTLDQEELEANPEVGAQAIESLVAHWRPEHG